MLCLQCDTDVDLYRPLHITCDIDTDMVNMISERLSHYTCYYTSSTYQLTYFCSLSCIALHLLRYGRITEFEDYV